MSAAIVVLAGTYLYIFAQVIKRQEKKADLAAAQALINAGKDQVFDAVIKDLK